MWCSKYHVRFIRVFRNQPWKNHRGCSAATSNAHPCRPRSFGSPTVLQSSSPPHDDQSTACGKKYPQHRTTSPPYSKTLFECNHSRQILASVIMCRKTKALGHSLSQLCGKKNIHPLPCCLEIKVKEIATERRRKITKKQNPVYYYCVTPANAPTNMPNSVDG